MVEKENAQLAVLDVLVAQRRQDVLEELSAVLALQVLKCDQQQRRFAIAQARAAVVRQAGPVGVRVVEVCARGQGRGRWRRMLPGDRLFNRQLELLERHCAVDEPIVNEESRGALY